MSYEPKFDGFRGLAGIDATGHVQIRSRQGTDLTAAFPDIATALARQLPPSTLLDGELVIWNGDRLDFSQLQRRLASPAKATVRTHPASYVMFDILQHDGHYVADQPQRVRRRLLESILPSMTPPLQITPATRDRAIAEQWFADYAAAGVGIEGLVIKSTTGTYQPGRRAWLKYRAYSSTEAIVGAVTGTLASPERVILGQPASDGSLLLAGTTTPLSPAQRLEVAAVLQQLTGTHPWPPNLPSSTTGSWNTPRRLPVTRVQPSLVVEVETDSAYQYGRFRHPTHLLRIRPELQPEDLWKPDSD